MNEERLDELIDAWRDNDLSDEQADELNALLRESEDARRTFADDARMHGLLHCAVTEEAVERVAAGPTPGQSRTPWAGVAIALCGLAAGIVVAVVAWQRGGSSAAPAELDPSVRVAELRYAEDADFAAAAQSPDNAIVVGSRLGPGVYQLKQGFVELNFFGGAVVALQAPAEIELRSQREARLLSGRLTVEAGDSERSFLLHTPAGEVVDIGTRYGVYVDGAGVTETHVFEGLVDVRPVSSNASVQRIEANSAMRISPAGKQESLLMDATTFPQPSRQIGEVLRHSGFESGTKLRIGADSQTGVWFGDVCQIVREHGKVRPYTGDRMLLFQSTGQDTQDGSETRASQLSQWIDLSPWRDAIADGRVQAKLTARFNRVAGDAETDSQFSIQLESFEVGSDEAQHLLKSGRLARSRTGHQLLSDSEPASWEKLEAVLTLPANSRCINVMILAFENVVNDDEVNEEFDGHFADDLHFHLLIEPASGETK
jgi:hypothetical protein